MYAFPHPESARIAGKEGGLPRLLAVLCADIGSIRSLRMSRGSGLHAHRVRVLWHPHRGDDLHPDRRAAPREIRDIRITNISADPIEIDAIPVLEYTHPDALKQLTNADWVPQTMHEQNEARRRHARS